MRKICLPISARVYVGPAIDNCRAFHRFETRGVRLIHIALNAFNAAARELAAAPGS